MLAALLCCAVAWLLLRTAALDAGPLRVPPDYGFEYSTADAPPGTVIAVGHIPLTFDSPVRAVSVTSVVPDVRGFDVLEEATSIRELGSSELGSFVMIVEHPDRPDVSRGRLGDDLLSSARHDLGDSWEVDATSHPTLVFELRVTEVDARLSGVEIEYRADGKQYRVNHPIHIEVTDLGGS